MKVKPFRIKVWHGTTEHHVVVKARSAEEAMEEALRVLKLSHKDVKRMSAEELNA